MNWLAPKLHLRLAQKQILTPGLVQMVSVLALNRLELREMINQEIMENPVLEELAEDGVTADSYTDEAFLKKETEKLPETPAANPFDEFDFGSFLWQYLDTGAERAASGEHEEIEKPSFDKFLTSPASLTDHLTWQLSVSICSETVRKIADTIVGNLDENGYSDGHARRNRPIRKLFDGGCRGSSGRGAGIRPARSGRAQSGRMPDHAGQVDRPPEHARAADHRRAFEASAE